MDYGADYAGDALLVKRGGCTFVKKVENAEVMGAKMVIVGDNEEGVQVKHSLM